MGHGSRTAVITAVFVNAGVTLLKFLAALIGRSASMMNEAIHSLMDTLNQCFLLLGLREAARPADRRYAFGHMQKKYLWNLWSAIGLFSLGCGLGLAHAWHGWNARGAYETPGALSAFGTTFDPVWVSLIVLALSLLLEGYSFLVATGEFLRRMRAEGYANPVLYIVKSDDPTLVAIVIEDSVAMLGLGLAAAGVGLAFITGNPVWDIAFSAVIAVMLGVAAFFLGLVNMRYLSDIRDSQAEASFAQVAGEHREVERYHDLRSIILDENHTVLVAEVSLREEVVLEGLRDRIERHRETLLATVPEKRRSDQALLGYVHARALVQATLERTEEIVHELERRLRERAPQVTHVTIEVEGIAPMRPGAMPEPARA